MNKFSTLKIFQKYLFPNLILGVIGEYEHENFKISKRVIFKNNFNKISTLKIYKKKIIKFSFYTQFQLINILLRNVSKKFISIKSLTHLVIIF